MSKFLCNVVLDHIWNIDLSLKLKNNDFESRGSIFATQIARKIKVFIAASSTNPNWITKT